MRATVALMVGWYVLVTEYCTGHYGARQLPDGKGALEHAVAWAELCFASYSKVFVCVCVEKHKGWLDEVLLCLTLLWSCKQTYIVASLFAQTCLS